MKLSFRDPDGFVFKRADRIFRCIYPHAASDLRTLLESPQCREWMAEGDLVRSEISSADSCREWSGQFLRGSLLVRHEPVRFPNYPHEWSPQMLHSAGELTLNLARQSLQSDFELKDATPHNVMFEGARPIFIDLLSFEKRRGMEGLWRPYAQFVRTFVYPLLASRMSGLRLDEIFLTHRDGLEPERMALMTPYWRWFTPSIFGLVTLPRLLSIGSRQDAPDQFRQRPCRDLEEARFLKQHALKRAKRALSRAMGASRRDSPTAHYMEAGESYRTEEFRAKENFVTDTLKSYRPKRVLDAGSNTGHFSRLAAANGASVVAVDLDPVCAGLLWQSASESGADILPLVVNIARPSPAIGWTNQETLSFLERAQGNFDCVFMLALLHHLVVTERVPLAELIGLAARLTTDLLVVEYVDPADRQFGLLARGRESLHTDLNIAGFEAEARTRFNILEYLDVSPTRRIYAMKRRQS